MYIIFLPSYVKCYGPIFDTFAVPAARYLRQPQVVLWNTEKNQLTGEAQKMSTMPDGYIDDVSRQEFPHNYFTK